MALSREKICALMVLFRLVQFCSSLATRKTSSLDPRTKKFLLVLYFNTGSQFAFCLTLMCVFRNDTLP